MYLPELFIVPIMHDQETHFNTLMNFHHTTLAYRSRLVKVASTQISCTVNGARFIELKKCGKFDKTSAFGSLYPIYDAELLPKPIQVVGINCHLSLNPAF